MIRLVVSLIAMCLLTSPNVEAQQREERLMKTDTLLIKKKIQLLGIPVVFYTPETNFGFGGGLQVFLPNQSNVYNSRLSNILTTAIYTTQKQFILESRPQIYFNAGDLFVDGLFRYRIFPNSFWGIGGNTPNSNREHYNMKTVQVKAAFLKRLPPSLNFGFEYNFENHDILDTEEGGLLSGARIPGAEGARISGLSFVFNLDDRDNMGSVVKGSLIQLKAGFSSRVFGADYSFNKYVIDFRKYFNLISNNTLAVQLYLESNYGDVPFQSMAWLGGDKKMRGYFKGRYIDKHMYILQTEYRWRFHKRWILTGFASAGEVSGSAGKFLNEPRASFGGGLRFKIRANKDTVVRLDVGIGESGNNGIYFGVNEAF